MKLNPLLAALIASFSASAIASGSIEVGTEYEDYNSNYSHNDLLLPYLYTSFSPLPDSPLRVGVRFNDRQMMNQIMPEDGNPYRNDRSRQEYLVSYRYNVTDNFTFSPGFRIRHEEYSQNDTRRTEWRVYPNMTYQVNDTVSLGVDGFIAPISADMGARGNDQNSAQPNDRFDYTDYLHELDFRFMTKFSDVSRLTTSLMSVYNKIGGVANAGELETRNELQLRFVYRHQFGDLTLSPFARIGLLRDDTDAVGNEREHIRHRFGVNGSYVMTNELDLTFGLNWQTEDQRDWSNNDVAAGAVERMVYQLGVRYNF
ncbi:hypothetical protein L4D20_23430 [Vibrio kyushuensis]|uniref:hypothetical protein n=1 Tax=Vibrio kyushuensis TaxID=2910249 RepID=UPI003D129707